MTDIFSSMLRTAAPILLAALGGLLCEKAGVLNLALEGMMLFGAFFGVMGSYYTDNAYLGVLIALLSGAVLGMIYNLFVERWKADAMITSIGMNSLALGMTSFLKRSIFGDSGIIMGISGIPKHNSSFLSSIPIIGKILDGQTTLVYVGLVLVIVLHFFLFRTHTGINLRAVGERPLAAASAGVSVAKYRFIALTVGGALCGLAGAHLSLGYVTMFSENMTAGRGFFAYTCVAFGQANPLLVMLASFIFGLAENLSYLLQGAAIPSQIILMAPYLCTILALIFRNFNLKKSLAPCSKNRAKLFSAKEK